MYWQRCGRVEGVRGYFWTDLIENDKNRIETIVRAGGTNFICVNPKGSFSGKINVINILSVGELGMETC